MYSRTTAYIHCLSERKETFNRAILLFLLHITDCKLKKKTKGAARCCGALGQRGPIDTQI